MTPTIGVVATGEMGSALGNVLRSGGARVITSLAGRSRRTAGLAEQAGILDAGSLVQVVEEAECLLSVVPPVEAHGLAERVAAVLSDRSRPLIYVDCNAIAPDTSRRIGRLITQVGGTYVDGGIIGFPPQPGPQQTRLWVSGEDAAQAMILADLGLDVREAGPRVGQASALKMCYAALTKGLTAIGMESFVTAASTQVSGPLRTELALSQASLLGWLERMVSSSPPKAHRWVGEMEEIAATFAEAGLTPEMFVGAAELYRFVAGTRLGRETPEGRGRRGLDETAEELLAEVRSTARSD